MECRLRNPIQKFIASLLLNTESSKVFHAVNSGELLTNEI